MLLDEGTRELLTELANLELKATDPNWLKTLERENVGGADERRTSAKRPESTSASKRESRVGVESKPSGRSGKSARRASRPINRTSIFRLYSGGKSTEKTSFQNAMSAAGHGGARACGDPATRKQVVLN